MTSILALDQSTSATKALRFRPDGSLLDSVSVEHHQYYPQPGWVEHDAEEIYHNTLQALGDLLQKTQVTAGDLHCLSITNQRETIVIFDRVTGAPLHRAIVWQCRRGDPICQALIAEGHNDSVQRKTGLRLDTYFPASKLRRLLDDEPHIRQQVEAGQALIGTIDTYLIYRLTGGQVFATDHTNASRTLLFNISDMSWDDDLCRLFGVPVHALPQVRESSAQFGTTDLEGRLPGPIPICGVMGDSQAALFAERCFSPGSAKVTFGTGSSILLNIGHSLRFSTSGNVTTIGWVYNGTPTYAFEGIINLTGATVAWLRDQLQLIATSAETEALARAVPDNGGVYLVPAFVGLSAPYWRADARAAIVGLTLGSTRNHVVRAALESIAYQVRDVLDSMAQDAGISLSLIHANGGAVQNTFLMQFVADTSRLQVRASTMGELSALGAVFSGALGSGLYTSLADLEKLPHTFSDYLPQMPPDQAEACYAGWQAAVQRVL
jgi:glycerol kinase